MIVITWKWDWNCFCVKRSSAMMQTWKAPKKFDYVRYSRMLWTPGLRSNRSHALPHDALRIKWPVLSHHSSAFGHTRLSIVDVSGGYQLILTNSSNSGIISKGETYNFQQIRKIMFLKLTFKTISNTEMDSILMRKEKKCKIRYKITERKNIMNNPNRMKDKAINVDIVKCSNCKQELRSSSIWIEDHQNILCETCYLNLVFPNVNDNYEARALLWHFDSSEIKSKVKQYLFEFVEGNYEILL